MTNKPRFEASIARAIAEDLVTALAPCCERITVAGSLQRLKPDVGDIEILFVPRVGEVLAPGQFFAEQRSLADVLLEKYLADGVLRKRLNKNGAAAWGTQNKLAVHARSGIPVDFFATPREIWFVALVLRTGSAATNVRLAASALRRGLKLHAYGVLERTAMGEQITPQSEREVFELVGVPYLEPAER